MSEKRRIEKLAVEYQRGAALAHMGARRAIALNKYGYAIWYQEEAKYCATVARAHVAVLIGVYAEIEP